MRTELHSISSPYPKSFDPELKYRGGKLLTRPSFGNIFLGDYYKKEEGKSVATRLNQFAKTFLTGKGSSIWKQYGVSHGKFLGSVTGPKVGKRISDSQLQSIIEKSISAGEFTKRNQETVFTVYLPPGTELIGPDGESSKEGMGGYHGSFDRANGERIYYAAIVNSDSKNGVRFNDNSFDNITIASSHEWTEATTDPDVNNGRLGYYSRDYGEVSDILIMMGIPLSQLYETVDGFAVQKEWSNKDHRVETLPR